jgi:DNA polymerase-3 subunit epsilon
VRPPGRTSWRAARFVVVDVETTGLDPRRDEVVAFAALPVEGGRVRVGGAVEGLVRSRRPSSRRSILVHGLRDEDLAGSPVPAAALAPLAEALRGRIPVAHAAWLERAFLRRALRSTPRRAPLRFVDTALLWRLLCVHRGDPDPGFRPLGDVAAALGLPAHRPHEAEGDALTTAQAFLALATHLEVHDHGHVGALRGAAWWLRAWRMTHERDPGG